MAANSADSGKDECYRCGYDLRGIAGNAACPECGLLALRSRRASDKLHDTRPRWLRSLYWGDVFILLSLLAPEIADILGVILFQLLPGLPGLWWRDRLDFLWLDVFAILLPIGVFLLTRPEGYAPADLADRRWRIAMRVHSFVPALAAVIVQVVLGIHAQGPSLWLVNGKIWRWFPLFLAAMSPLPLLLFIHLRGLAKRARSAHLAEHCLITAVGIFLYLLYWPALLFVLNNLKPFGLDYTWRLNSETCFVMILIAAVAGCLFFLWMLYLLIRFAGAFYSAKNDLRRKWRVDDRSLSV